MFEEFSEELAWGDQKLVISTGKFARQSLGSVLVSLGETVVHAAVTARTQPTPNIDFLPLTVIYQERFYGSGKIPGGFFKREGRSTEKETLTARLIDRPIRPLFSEKFRCETQVICTVLSNDLQNNPDILALIAASAAITLSGLPFAEPIAAARVGVKDGEMVLNPAMDEMDSCDLDLIVAGTAGAVMMVESEASELSEDMMLKAVMFGHKAFCPVIDAILSLAKKAAKAPWVIPDDLDESESLFEKIEAQAGELLQDAYKILEKQNRRQAIEELKNDIKKKILADEGAEGDVVKELLFDRCWKKMEQKIIRERVLQGGKRIDGRDRKTVRPIDIDVGLLPRTHGSALFTRGETQALVVTTLGTGDDEQIVNTVERDGRERFMLHYNFPPYCVGEVGRMMGPGRREIGHGKLAWRALRAVLPDAMAFPYTIRIVSEIMESNGSSSMATVCGGSLAMMDAGVPIRTAVAGIAMGLVLGNDGEYAILTDILGDEDHLGDMDFKVAGTDIGVTSLQMDIKVAGVTEDVMRQALADAREARLHILGMMNKVINEGRDSFSATVPQVVQFSVPIAKIRNIIGSGGKVIKSIVEETGAKVNIDDDGVVSISSQDAENIRMAKDKIMGIIAEPEVGVVYTGTVVKLMDFGAFVNFFPSKDGLVHISQITGAERGDKPADLLKEGQSVKVKLLGFDERGKVRLSMKAVDQVTGEDISSEQQ
jgi:polyribonucleotide nucleotidyltransferase